MKNIIFKAKDEKASEAFGKTLSAIISPGDVIALDGELGAGKTTFTRGLVRGLFKDKTFRVKSPSFAIVNQYEGPFPVFHIDCYRLEGALAFDEIGIDEFLFSEGVTVIEWAERMTDFLTAKSIRIKIEYAETGRLFSLWSDDKCFMQKAKELFA